MVVRDGAIVTIDAVNLVPGDVILIRLGNIVPADVKLLEEEGADEGEQEAPMQVRWRCVLCFSVLCHPVGPEAPA
eukprot:scaffold199094_cov18-Tisochrysis_lutea.AAC.3